MNWGLHPLCLLIILFIAISCGQIPLGNILQHEAYTFLVWILIPITQMLLEKWSWDIIFFCIFYFKIFTHLWLSWFLISLSLSLFSFWSFSFLCVFFTVWDANCLVCDEWKPYHVSNWCKPDELNKYLIHSLHPMLQRKEKRQGKIRGRKLIYWILSVINSI